STIPQVVGTTFVLTAQDLVGQLDTRAAFRPARNGLNHDFELRQDDGGQWRIGRPPESVLINRALFENFYTTYNLYFYDPAFLRLVPDPIFLPYSSASTQLAGALMQGLILGPTDFLRASVRNAVPAGSQLQTQSVVAVSGVAELQLGDEVLALNDDQRKQLVAQIGWTLNQVDKLIGLRISDGALQVSGVSVGAGADSYVPIDMAQAIRRPVPELVTTLYGLRGDAMVLVDELDNRVESRPVPGPLGAGRYELTAVGVSELADQVAAVTAKNELLVGALGGQLKRVLSGVGPLLAPQVIGNETWTISQRDGVAVVWVVRDDKAVRVGSSALPDGKIRAFRLAPDGVRMAVVRTVQGGSRLGLVAIDRGSDALVLGSLRPIEVVSTDDAEAPLVVVDVDWQGSTTLMVLAGADLKASIEPFSVSQDGYAITKIGPSNTWGAAMVTASPTIPTVAMIVGSKNTSYQFASQSRWDFFSGELRFLTYPG
ncbi:MAG: LpqB family beta-propeller domain-containing protein, partial [Propionibacteriaceae bacterium]